jgi:hypothetical protein
MMPGLFRWLVEGGWKVKNKTGMKVILISLEWVGWLRQKARPDPLPFFTLFVTAPFNINNAR